MEAARKFIRKKSRIEAVRWDGHNQDAVVQWAQGGWRQGGIWLKQKWQGDDVPPQWSLVIPPEMVGDRIGRDGEVEANPGEWLVKSHDGYLGVMTNNELVESYEPV